MNRQKQIRIRAQIVCRRIRSTDNLHAVDLQVLLVVVDVPDVLRRVRQNGQRVLALVGFGGVAVERGADFEFPLPLFRGHTVNFAILFEGCPRWKIPVDNFQNRRVKVIQIAGLDNAGVVHVFYALRERFRHQFRFADNAREFDRDGFLTVGGNLQISADKPVLPGFRHNTQLGHIQESGVRVIREGRKGSRSI